MSSTPIGSGKTFPISTLSDILDLPTPEHVAACLRDLSATLVPLAQLYADAGLRGSAALRLPLQWTDDGSRHADIYIETPDGMRSGPVRVGAKDGTR